MSPIRRYRALRARFGVLGLLVISSAVAGACLFVVVSILQFQAANREAIRVSCQLLANAITQSGAGSSQGPARRDYRPPPQMQLTLLYRAHLESTMSPQKRAVVKRLKREVAQGGGGSGGGVSVPDCARIVRDPASVKAGGP